MEENRKSGELIGYVEYISDTTDRSAGELIGYVEYTGDAAGSTTSNIPTIGEVLGYVEYIEAVNDDRTAGEVLGYLEYIKDDIDREASELVGYVEYIKDTTDRNAGELVGYVEYTGDAAGSTTSDIPTTGEVIGYVEYIDEVANDRTVGEVIAYMEYTPGFAGIDVSTSRPAYTKGLFYTSGSKQAYIYGTIRSYKSAYISVIVNTTNSKHAYIGGKYTASLSSSAYMYAGSLAKSGTWWQAPDTTPSNTIAAYLARKAQSYSESKINRENPGTYDVVEGTSYPTWNSSTGWTFNQTSANYFTTGIVINTPITFIARIGDLTGSGGRAILGPNAVSGLGWRVTSAKKLELVKYGSGVIGISNTAIQSGDVIAVSYLGYNQAYKFYLNGVPDGSGTGGYNPSNTTILIGKTYTGEAFGGDIYAIAIYNVVLADWQIETISRNVKQPYSLRVYTGGTDEEHQTKGSTSAHVTYLIGYPSSKKYSYLRGILPSTSSKSAFVTGMPSSTHTAYLYGGSKIHVTTADVEVETHRTDKQHVSSMGVQVETHDTDKQRITSIALQVEWSRKSKSSKSAYTAPAYPPGQMWDFKVAYIASIVFYKRSKSAYLAGVLQTQSSKLAYVHSWNPTDSSKSAYISVTVNTTNVKHALVHSGTHVSGSSGAYLAGATNRWIHQAYLEGMGTPRLTSEGIMVETTPSNKITVTAGGIQVETRATSMIRVTSAGIMLEWENITPLLGPQLWNI